MIVIPGLNSLIENKGVQKSYLKILKDKKYKVIALEKGNIEKQLEEIFKRTKNLFNKKEGFLGGDHSISYPLCLNFFKKHKKNSKLIVFDAHPDLMKPLAEPTHEEWLRAIIENGFPAKNILLIGIRRKSKNIDFREIDFAKKNKLKIIYSDEFIKKENKILDFIEQGDIYISVDIDVLDSSIVDFTGYPEKEGLNLQKFLDILNKIKNKGKVQAYDFVEINFEKGKTPEKKAIEISQKILKSLDFD